MKAGNQVVPTSTALQARVMIYQPSQRPQERKGQWMDTGFGRCRVTGRLGQRHADIVEDGPTGCPPHNGPNIHWPAQKACHRESYARRYVHAAADVPRGGAVHGAGHSDRGFGALE